MTTRLPLRYRWSHHHPLHRTLVRAANRVFALVPMRIKYTASTAIKRKHLPYSALTADSVAIQVGAPSDTLHSGRARAMTFARLTAGGTGRCIVIEPDPSSVDELRAAVNSLGYDHVEVIHAGAWNERSTLELLVDPTHPATNVLSGLATDPEARDRYDVVEVEAGPLDDLLADVGLGRVDVLSITTNGAERQILAGAGQLLERVSLLALARTDEDFSDVLGGSDFEFVSFDDRGMTYRRAGA